VVARELSDPQWLRRYALVTGIKRKKVSFVLDADVRGFSTPSATDG